MGPGHNPRQEQPDRHNQGAGQQPDHSQRQRQAVNENNYDNYRNWQPPPQHQWEQHYQQWHRQQQQQQQRLQQQQQQLPGGRGRGGGRHDVGGGGGGLAGRDEGREGLIGEAMAAAMRGAQRFRRHQN